MDVISAVVGLGAGLVVLAIAVNAMLRKNAGVSSEKIDALEVKFAEKVEKTTDELWDLAVEAKTKLAVLEAQAKAKVEAAVAEVTKDEPKT